MALPTPEAGLVICYSYLWKHEALAGQIEGRKDRPCAIVIAQQDRPDGLRNILVAPISHNPPQDPTRGIEIPLPVKRRLGLDDRQSWIHFEVNRFLWPGPDLRPISRSAPDQFAYGFLPPRLFRMLVKGITDLADARRLKLTPRSDKED